MPSLHDQLLAESGTPVLLDVQGEVVTFLPKEGAPRSIRAAVEELGSQAVRSDQQEQDEQSIRILCRRHPTLGIDTPSHGDRLLRGTDVDPRQREYLFAGTIDVASPADWILEFARKVPRRAGLEQRGGQ